jgi:Ribbon-helix-helix protein, copG family
MRTTLDLPDPLLRQLKSRAALEGTTLKQLIRDAIERGLNAPPQPGDGARQRSTPPSLVLGRPMRVKRFSNAALCELLEE